MRKYGVARMGTVVLRFRLHLESLGLVAGGLATIGYSRKKGGQHGSQARDGIN
jgi:hypothetical protein